MFKFKFIKGLWAFLLALVGMIKEAVLNTSTGFTRSTQNYFNYSQSNAPPRQSYRGCIEPVF